MSLCVKTPLWPEGTAYAHDHVGTRYRRVALPENGPKTVSGLRALSIAQDPPGGEAAPPGGESEDSVLAIALGGCSLQLLAAVLEGRFTGPAWRVTLHPWLRLQRASCRQELFVARGPCAIMNVDPTDGTQLFSAPVPVPRARDHLDGSCGASIPCHREAGAGGCVRHPLLGRGQFLALHARAAHWVTHTRGRRCVQRGITSTLAHPGEGLAVLLAKPRRRAGAVATVADADAGSSWEPAPQARPPPPDHGGRRRRAHALHSIPRGGTVHSHQDGEGPRACRARPLDEHRHDAPRRPPAIGDRAGGRAYALALPSLAQHLRARGRGDRLVACQQHRPGRYPIVQQARDQGPREGPGRPAALGKPPRIRRDRSLRLKPNGAKPVRDGSSPRRQYGRESQAQKPVIRRGGKRGPTHHE